MEIWKGIKEWYNPDIRLLTRGEWAKSQLIINPLLPDANVPIPEIILPQIEKKWVSYNIKNPKAFPGDTVRYCGYHDANGLLVIDVVYSDYRLSQTLGWLGAAMVPVTSDGYIALQAPVAKIAANVGGGIRVPGCTPRNIHFFSHVIEEMKEEFSVNARIENLKVLGLAEVKPLTASHHYFLIFKVKLRKKIGELKTKWAIAKDNWEGELMPIPLTKEKISEVIFSKEFAETSRIALFLVAESELGDLGLKIVV